MTPVAEICDVIQKQLKAKTTIVKDVIATARNNVQQLTSATKRLNAQQTIALPASEELKQKYIKEIN